MELQIIRLLKFKVLSRTKYKDTIADATIKYECSAISDYHIIIRYILRIHLINALEKLSYFAQ